MVHGVAKVGKRERKRELLQKGLISCGICKFHRRENATNHKPKPDRYKAIDRKTIRNAGELNWLDDPTDFYFDESFINDMEDWLGGKNEKHE